MTKVQESIKVDAPVEQCYQRFTQFNRFPDFMEHIQSVKPVDDLGVWHWKADGPFSDVEWDAKWATDDTNRRITWHTVDDSDLDMSGSVGFADLGNNQTQITSIMEINPPAGKLGELAAKLFSDPEKMVKEDLKNFKRVVERQPALAR